MGSSHSKGTNNCEEASKNPRLKSSKRKSKQKRICTLEDLCPNSSTKVVTEKVHNSNQGSSSTPEYSIDQLYPLLKKPAINPLLKRPVGTESSDGGPVRRYPTGIQRRGPVFIINNFFGSDNGFEYRDGSWYDIGKLKIVFEDLKFTVHDRANLKAQEMKNYCMDLARRDYSDVDCAVVVILTHGVKKGYLKGVDNECIGLLELISPFYANPTLIGKPKIFIIQACRGKEYSKGIKEPSDSKISTATADRGERSDEDFQKSAIGNSSEIDDNDETIVEKYVSSGFLPRNADIVIAYACSEGEVSFRNSRGGTWYIEQLTEALWRSKGKEIHFTDILTEVQGMMSNLTTSEGKNNVTYVQMPEFRSTLRGPLYL